jgi:hypothetical protein
VGRKRVGRFCRQLCGARPQICFAFRSRIVVGVGPNVEGLGSRYSQQRAESQNRDYDAEFSLRGIEPPYDLVSEAHDLLYTNMQKWMDGLSAEDMEKFSEGVEKHFKEFQAKRDKAQN